ncbi:MAG: chitobiase/beta-hexosaminidase C-terminal domain-containing protein [Candidatus Acidiferrales bacterium]
MRTFLVSLMLAGSASYAQAQGPAAQATQQQAVQQMQMNAPAAQQNAQQVTQQTQQAAQATQPTSQTGPVPICCSASAMPKFSLKAGAYKSPQTVRITDSIRGATIYYTTDGWTPTAASSRYLGPITISSTTTLQAIAIVPFYGPYGEYYGRSFVVSAQYTIKAPAAATSFVPSNPPAPSEPAPAGSTDGKLMLAKGRPVPLVFGADISSSTAAVGDQIPLTLSDDLRVGNVVVVPKGSPAVALVIQVDKTGPGGGPGDITFQVNSLTVNGSVIRLRGFATKEGEAKPPNVGVMMIPVVGPFTVFRHGTDAEIKQGTLFIAFVDADISLPPAK